MATITKQLQRSRQRRELSENKLATKRAEAMRWYLNSNLEVTRKRRTGWTMPGPAERDFSGNDRCNAMAQARQMIEESPLGVAILQRHLDHVVGPEFRLSMRTPDREWNQEVEARWELRKDNMDIRGLRSWGGLVRLWQARRVIDGDMGIVLVADESDGAQRSFVQTIEADRIAKPEVPTDSGIEFNEFGAPVAFHVAPREAATTPKSAAKRYAVRDFVYSFYAANERAESQRGQSAFLPLLNLLKDYNETVDAMCQKVKNAAFIGLVFKREPTPDGTLFGSAQTSGTDEGGTTRPHVKIVPGVNLDLMPGESAEMLESKQPNPEFVPFLRWQIRMAGAAIGIPLEFLFADPTETNYSGLMALAQMFRKAIRVQQMEVRRICSRVFQWELSRAVKYGEMKPPAGVTNFSQHTWGVPSGGFIDPQKEAEAWVLLLENRLTTREQILSEIGNGSDFDTTLTQQKREVESMEAAGIEERMAVPAQAQAVPPDLGE